MRVNVIRVAEIAGLTVDSDNINRAKADIMETAKKFPDRLNWQKPKKGEDIIIQIG